MKRIRFHALAFLVTAFTIIGLISGCLPDIPDIDPPYVQIVYPASGAFVNGNVQIVASATDDDEVSEIRIYIDGKVVTSTAQNFLSFSWNTTPIADNLTHYVSAVAIDASDNVGYSQVVAVTVVEGQNHDNVPPVVTILYPVGGQIISGSVNIVAQASDDSEVDRVEFYIDGFRQETVSNPPYDYLWDTTTEDSGAHSIFLRAYDTNDNSSASATITVTVVPPAPNNNVNPAVKITSPQRNRVLLSKSETGSVPIEIEIQNEVSVEKVELYIDGNLKGVFSENLEKMIHYEWNLDDYGDGLMHTIFVKAIGKMQNSAADLIVVTVNP